MALPFRKRILLVLIALGAVPTAALVVGWALTVRRSNPVASAEATIAELGASGRRVLGSIDTTSLSEPARRALVAHTELLNEALGQTRRASTYSRYYSAGLALALLGLGALLVYASVRVSGHLSRQLSRPIDDLIGWTERIRRRESLPEGPPPRGAPEFTALRAALREMAAGLDKGRAKELEAARLRAFQEVARRVAHEMKNPLTPIRLAVSQLRAVDGGQQEETLEILEAESARLEEMAREFSEFGRLPEGPRAEVDLAELLEELVRTTLPPTMNHTIETPPTLPIIQGQYDPLRRAFSNLIRNAAEAMEEVGTIALRLEQTGHDAVMIEIRDHGPGISPEDRTRVFEPYFTRKARGTGLGLALVRQTIEHHRGSIELREAHGGGTAVVVTLPIHNREQSAVPASGRS
jgi:signal transduction histidine kinase